MYWRYQVLSLYCVFIVSTAITVIMSRTVETDSDVNAFPLIQVSDSEPPNTDANTNDVSEPSNRRMFLEKPNQIPDEFEYPRNGEDAGLVIIFNQEEFETQNRREGTRKDVEDLIHTLGRLGFNLDEKFVFNDLKRSDILNEIELICKQDHTKRNCLIVIFLTHGSEENMLSASDADLQTKEIWEQFVKCDSLKNKPKLFIFQACKGAGKSKAFNDGLTANEALPNDRDKFKIVPKDIFSSPLEADMVLVYSAVEGNAAFREPEKGTWFIQELCRNFLSHGRRDDVISLLIRVSKCVATYETSERYKQMPTFVSTLTKRFYLMKSKDRNITLSIKKNHEEILKLLRELTVRVDALYEARDGKK